MKAHSKGVSARDIALCAVMAALLEVSKLALSALANIELVSFLILLFACHFGWRVLAAVAAFVGLEIMVWGFGVWTFSYLYVWPILALIALALKNMQSSLGWALVSGFFGLAFGALCAVANIFLGGWQYAVSWWLSGIPFDLIHCAGNFVIALLLWNPMGKLCKKVKRSLFNATK